MTPQERRQMIDRLVADLEAERAKAKEAFAPLAKMYNLAATRLSQIERQLKVMTQVRGSDFGEHNDPPAGEADLDAALNRG